MEAMAALGLNRLPVEIIYRILWAAVAQHIDDVVLGPRSQLPLPFYLSESGEPANREDSDLVESLLLTSYQFHQVSLQILSDAFDIPLREERLWRLEQTPWNEVALTRKFCAMMRELDYSQLDRLAEIAKEPASLISNAVREVLAPRLDGCLRKVVIVDTYDLPHAELQLRWDIITRQLSTLCQEAIVSRTLEMLLGSHQGKIQGMQAADARALAEWDHAVSLDESIGIERLAAWCTLLRKTIAEQHCIENLAEVKTAAGSLLEVFNRRLDNLRSRASLSGATATTEAAVV
ncbi:uncharacterized protein PHACADRAFT_181998 [Phanerochaete carnosa HHB-10118-sp]|uniref:Uncharacterized protein n=1 Tax=Phanerochaete carnosa (strain HHB-10118-sp) TaxID=650164 RepID=K5W0S3_PHACS|nr:uncharacterized protein PHACADRAFT_181998 [Phanerochaete carnosa HHB-10118-sp]EKM57418.1 hypothetical protein PHACADRAFT_181998 [Phanerochaete carnosa HHB-10118-sp]